MPHIPAAQVAVPFATGGHTLPHAPQFCGSADALRHWLPHGTKPGSHSIEHRPETHVAEPFAGLLQATPQFEQFDGSAMVSAQTPLQFSSPRGHMSVQLPPTQTSPSAQSAPHIPQLFGSDESNTHDIPHLT